MELGWGIRSPDKLETLKIIACKFLENDASSLHGLQSLRKLNIRRCSSWKTLNGIEDLQALEELEVEYCD